MARAKKAPKPKDLPEEDRHTYSDFSPASGAWYAVCSEGNDDYFIHRVIGWMNHHVDGKPVGVTPLGPGGLPLSEWDTNFILTVAGDDKAPNGQTWAAVYNTGVPDIGNYKEITEMIRATKPNR